jgi:hypothetical protein
LDTQQKQEQKQEIFLKTPYPDIVDQIKRERVGAVGSQIQKCQAETIAFASRNIT